MAYNLTDLQGDYKRRPRYISFDKQQKLLKEAYESENSFRNTVATKFINRLKFTAATTSLFKPITETQKETTKTIAEAENLAKQELQKKLDEQIKNIGKAIEYNQNASDNLAVINEANKTKYMVNHYLTKENRDNLFGIVEFHYGEYKFGCVEELNNFGYLENGMSHVIEFDYEIKKILVKREYTSVLIEYNLTDNIMRYLASDVSDIGDENSKREYLAIVHHAIVSELKVIARGGGSQRRREILEIFRSNRKFIDLIAPVYGIKSVSYKDRYTPGDRLGHTRPRVVSSSPNEQYKRLMVLLGTKKSLGEKDNYNIGLEEFTAILDELLKAKEIDKMTYKTFLLKYNK